MDSLAGFFFFVQAGDRPLRVRQRDSLREQPDTAVVLGEGPDGLPLVLSVRRPGSVAPAVLAALGRMQADELPPSIATALDGLEVAVRDEGRRIGIEESELGAIYRSAGTVGALLGDTLLARLIGAASPLILPDDRWQPSSSPDRVANTAVMAQVERPVTAMKELDRERYMVVPVRSGPVFVAELNGDDDPVRSEVLQPLRLEDLRAVASARFHTETAGVAGGGAMADQTAYARAVRDAERLLWTVGRDDVGRIIAGLARDLHNFHDEGRVHCDVKPANALITAAGATSIDPIGVRAGERSPGATPGWAAPEQILGRPVSPATDVYALGLMASSLVGAVLFGEERCFIIPTGRDGRRRLRLLASPDVFLDPSSTALADSTRAAWCDLIRRACAFDPAARPPTGAAFADELESLLDDQPLAGDLPIRGGPGNLRRSVNLLGALQPSWIIEDRR